MRVRIGLDVGGTKTDAVAVGPDGHIARSLRIPTGYGVEAVTRTITQAVAGVLDGASAVASVGVGIPGQVDPQTGLVRHALNLGIDRVLLAELLEPLLGVPVHVENDVKAAALGAFSLGDQRGSLAYINLGTGVAAGIISNGVVWRGDRGGAGEVGHIVVDPAGPLCQCGQRGCIEALVGGAAVAARWGKPSELPVRDVFDAADRGDKFASEVRDDLVRAVAAAVRVLVLTTDAGTVMLGGGVSALGSRLYEPVVAELTSGAQGSPFLRSLGLAERLEMLPPGSAAAALGAALIAEPATVV